MTIYKLRNIVSILMDSSLYFTVPLRERLSLLTGMVENYPFLVITDSARAETERDSTRTCIFRMDKQENI